MGEEQKDHVKTNETVNRCIKCKCSLAAADKTSKLLPCLHTMCDDCVSGRTDVLERARKHKEEKEKESPEKEPKEEDQQGKEGKEEESEGKSKEEKEEDKTEPKNEEAENKEDTSKPHADTAVEEMQTGEPTPEPVPLTECPTCREPFVVENLIENVFIRKHAAGVDDTEGGEHQCTGCESNPATSYCLQCDDWLCTDCVDAHKRVRMTKDHQLTSREEAAANRANSGGPSEVSMLCRVHPKEKLTLFCEKCEVLTCRDCQLLQHQEHKYQFLQEAADSYKAKLSGSLSLMKDRRDILKRYQTEIEERLNKVRKEKGELQQEILKQADVIVKAVRAAVWSVLSSLHSFTDAAAKRLSREVGDVGDLVGKFDHCIAFMDTILEDGFGLPLLFSKSIVETKCRKVYHTHMEPQSLKGQLNIQYRHDVPALIRSLSHIGAIYVNGSKYPPEKSSASANSTAQSPSTPYSRGPPNTVVGAPGNAVVVPQQNISSHVQDRSLYMQMMMGRQSHAPTTPTQGSTLSLPGSRRVGMAARTAWNSQPQVGLNPGQTGMITGMMVGPDHASRGQSLLASRAPFTPMRLHHRPVDQMPTVPPMMLGSQLRHQPPQPMALGTSHLPAPPPLRSPQPSQYRGAAEAGHLNSGGQAAMSGVRRGLDSQDPARPASGGHTPERPHSAERNDAASAVGMRVKSEPTDSSDCVITSAVIKGKKSPVLPAATSLGELQKNLDEVLRGVPLDLGDNLEQINGDSINTSLASVRSPQAAPSILDRTSRDSPPAASVATTTTASTTPTTSAEERPRAASEETPTKAAVSNGADSGAVFEATGPQVKGYATGNSMPGFTLAAVDTVDPNDDYCAACHQGGDVLCCDKCPRVYHLQCHVPVLNAVPSGAFVCTLCEEGLVAEGQDSPAEGHGKRKAPTGLSDRDLKVCERILLELFCHPSSIPFHEPVNRAVPNYYKIITNPMDFTKIKNMLSRNHFNHYASVEAFLDDLRLVFKNCAVYNAETSEVGKAGKMVREYFERLVSEHMPSYLSYVRRVETTDTDSKGAEHAMKKRKTTPPPHHHHSHSTNSNKSGTSDPLVHVQ